MICLIVFLLLVFLNLKTLYVFQLSMELKEFSYGLLFLPSKELNHNESVFLSKILKRHIFLQAPSWTPFWFEVHPKIENKPTS